MSNSSQRYYTITKVKRAANLQLQQNYRTPMIERAPTRGEFVPVEEFWHFRVGGIEFTDLQIQTVELLTRTHLSRPGREV